MCHSDELMVGLIGGGAACPEVTSKGVVASVLLLGELRLALMDQCELAEATNSEDYR